jgi:hypothetical protein
VARRFRFRVREGSSLIAYDERRAWTEGPGYELVLEEKEAAELFRSRAHRAFDLIEVIEDAPGAARKLPG